VDWTEFGNRCERGFEGSRRKHPTLDVCIQLMYILDKMGGDRHFTTEVNQQEKMEAFLKESLRYLPVDDARTVGVSPQSRPLKLESLLVKARRFDGQVHTRFHDLISCYLDNSPHADNRYKAIRSELSIQIDALRSMVAAYYAMLQAREEQRIELKVLTTRHLELRFWPPLIKQFQKQVEDVATSNYGIKAVSTLTSVEPDRAINMVEQRGLVDDLILAYASRTQLAEALKKNSDYVEVRGLDIHRCLIGTREHIPLGKPLARIIEDCERIAIQEHAAPFFRDLPNLQIPSTKLHHQRTTVNVHAYCQGGSGVGLSYLEFLDETEQKVLEVLPIDPVDSAAPYRLALLRRKESGNEFQSPPTTGDRSVRGNRSAERVAARKSFVDNLCGIAEKTLVGMEYSFGLSTSINTILSQYRYSYNTVAHVDQGSAGKGNLVNSKNIARADRKTRSQSPTTHGDAVEVHAWRGNFILSVRTGLLVHGIGTIYGDFGAKDTKRREAHDHPVFGRLNLGARNDSANGSPSQETQLGQIVLEISNNTHEEISLVSLLVELQLDGKHRCKAIRTPTQSTDWKSSYLIGQWLGRDLSAGIPNSGIFILHKSPDLSLAEIQKIVTDYGSRVTTANVKGQDIRYLYGKRPDGAAPGSASS
jgi:hypothetical protein